MTEREPEPVKESEVEQDPVRKSLTASQMTDRELPQAQQMAEREPPKTPVMSE